MIGGLGFGGVASAEVIQGTAAAGGFSRTDATVFEINEVGRSGHHLIVPYYTVQNGQSTAFHITNTDTDHGKAVKVRFRGAGNSDDVLDFQVFLSPGDVWAAGLDEDPVTGRMRIFTVDNSCTIPRFGRTPGEFGNKENGEIGYLLSSSGNVGSGGAAATREGYIEIFNMADLDKDLASGLDTAKVSETIKHDSDGVPACNPRVLEKLVEPDSLSSSKEVELRSLGFDTPSTGLTGDWYILNLAENTAFSGASLAIEARVERAGIPGRGNFVVFPQTRDAYGGANANAKTADPLLRTENVGVEKNSLGSITGTAISSLPINRPLQFDFPDMSTPYLAGSITDPLGPIRQIAQLSRAIRSSGVVNQYVVTGADFDTDWVFSMPTRRYSVALDYDGGTENNERMVFTQGVLSDGRGIDTDTVIPVLGHVNNARPFFYSLNAQLRKIAIPGYNSDQPRICIETSNISFTNREEAQTRTIQVPSPGVAGVFSLCGETTILQMNKDRPVLGGILSSQVSTPPYSEGWGFISVDGNTTDYLPVVGYAAIRAKNSSSTPVQNFGYTWPHRYR